jgi:ATP-dependent Clp protease adaptor protein ClpS
MSRTSIGTDQATLSRTREQSGVPPRYKVILHNDDYTTMEFVVAVLTRYFNKDETEALRIMLEVHTRGSGVAGAYPRDQAETKVAQVTAEAEREGFPLLVTMEAE